jgi:hypothetical protein
MWSQLFGDGPRSENRNSWRSTAKPLNSAERTSKLASPLTTQSSSVSCTQRFGRGASAHVVRISVQSATWSTIEALNVVDNDAQLVAGTKTLHHLLPDLVPPMDREYAQRFFRWHSPQFQYGQEKCFKIAFAALVLVARQVDPRQYVGTHPWHTSATKVLDNALVGFMCAVDDGVDSGKPADKLSIETPPPSAMPSKTVAKSRTTRFADVWNRIESNAGNDFVTMTGLPFTYSVAHGALRPSRANRNIPRSDFEKALARVPLKNTAGVQDLQGPSFVYAILMDERIRGGEW